VTTASDRTEDRCPNCGRLVSGGDEGVGALCICDERGLRRALAAAIGRADLAEEGLEDALLRESMKDNHLPMAAKITIAEHVAEERRKKRRLASATARRSAARRKGTA